MSDYEKIQQWKNHDIENAKDAIEQLTANIAVDTAFVAEFSETNPDVAQFYRDWIVDHQRRLQYFQDRYAKLTA
jgi:hypothetical protein